MCTGVRNFVRVPSERYDFKPSHGSVFCSVLYKKLLREQIFEGAARVRGARLMLRVKKSDRSLQNLLVFSCWNWLFLVSFLGVDVGVDVG